MLTGSLVDLVQLRQRRANGKISSAAVSRSGRAPVCLVTSDSWLLTFALGLAGRKIVAPKLAEAGSAINNSAAGMQPCGVRPLNCRRSPGS
jgi:hypothetical protein